MFIDIMQISIVLIKGMILWLKKLLKQIDERIQEIMNDRQAFMEKGDYQFSNQIWARIDELKRLKELYSDKEDKWKI